jgi:hypothetical protein
MSTAVYLVLSLRLMFLSILCFVYVAALADVQFSVLLAAMSPIKDVICPVMYMTPDTLPAHLFVYNQNQTALWLKCCTIPSAGFGGVRWQLNPGRL